MSWNPDKYDQFKTERQQPFYDALQLIEIKNNLKVIDLGCGTGELTRMLADYLPGSRVLGIDTSIEMLGKSKDHVREHLTFELRSIEDQVDSGQHFDLVFSNAALQWVEDHWSLFPRIISMINPGGQLVIQIPSQHRNLTNKLLEDLSHEEPFCTELKNYIRKKSVLETEQYAQLLFENGGEKIKVMEKIYPVVVKNSDAVYDWAAGTALLPYVERLQGSFKDLFIEKFKFQLNKTFDKSPVFYPFKRMIISASF